MAETSETRFRYEMPDRVVVLGDLNADDDALELTLRALKLIDDEGDWCATRTHFVQVGDVVNRGASARAALERLQKLQRQAPAFDSHVTVLLGNHEAMVTLGNYAWCSPEEFLEFATPAEKHRFEVKRSEAIMGLLHGAQNPRGTDPVLGQIRAWEERHVPGREAYEEAMGKKGSLGKFIRSMPVAIVIGRVLFTHGGIGLKVARLGLEAMNENVQNTWQKGPESELDLHPESILLSDEGPLWNRRFALGTAHDVEHELRSVLASFSASSMIVGHTRTEHMENGKRGHPCSRFNNAFICSDTGIGSTSGSLGAVVIENDTFFAWRPDGMKTMGAVPPLGEFELTAPSHAV